jgi:pyrroline-5-carboxylate reductase
MKIGIIGSGDVAKTLAGGFLRNDWVHAFKLLT